MHRLKQWFVQPGQTVRRAMVAAIVAIAAIGSSTYSAHAQSTEPAASQPARGERGERGGGQVGRFRETMKQLELSDEQKSKIEAIFKEEEPKIAELRQSRQGGDQQATREKARNLMEELRTKISAVLTPEQQEKLRSLMQSQRGSTSGPARRGEGKGGRRGRDGNGPPTSQPAGDGASQKASADDNPNASPPMMSGEKSTTTQPNPAAESAAAVVSEGFNSSAKTLAAGQAAPDFTAAKIDGANNKLSLSNFKDKTLVMLFGSYSSPSFRSRVVAFDQMRRDFNTRASFLIVYTKEAHPTGGWEVDRNKDNDIQVPPATTVAERAKAAQSLRERFKLQTPIVIDDMSDAIATAYHATPNDAAVLIKDGTVVAAQQWFDPYAMREALVATFQSSDAK